MGRRDRGHPRLLDDAAHAPLLQHLPWPRRRHSHLRGGEGRRPPLARSLVADVRIGDRLRPSVRAVADVRATHACQTPGYRRSSPAMRLAWIMTYLLLATAASAVEPHRSFSKLPTGNGHTFAVYDVGTKRVNDLREHPYLYPSDGVQTRNLCYDTYFGARVGTSATWLTEPAISEAGYLGGTNIVRVVQRHAAVRFETYLASPFGLEAPGLMMLVSASSERPDPVPVSLFSLHNFHMGTGSPTPGAEGERIVYDATRATFVETGPGTGALVYRSLGAPTRHAASPQNPFEPVRQGQDL